jgi:hypothetical protein
VRAAARNALFSSAVPIVTRTPSSGYGCTLTPASAHVAANARVRRPSGSQTKFASDGGTSNPSASSAAWTRSRSLTVRPTRLSSSASARRDAIAAAWATWLTLNGSSRRWIRAVK